ncbi:MAG: DUF1156 domain-containing protein, partial [Thermoproteota archaeon]
AGFGSIPLEGMRLGLDCTAVELLPTAYVFLKAVLEYPSKYGENLVKDVERWGNWITEKLKEDPLIKELYDNDVAVYIGSWEILCPNCGRWTPLVGNWWLARVKDAKGYERLAYMQPKISGDKIEIQVIDLNKIEGDENIKKAKVLEQKIKVGEKEYQVPESNISARQEKAVCLHCNQPIMQYDPQTGKHYTETKKLPKEVKDRLEGYIKYALKTYNQSLEHEDVTPVARQRLLVKVKVKDKNLEFEPCTEKDQEKLELARKEVAKMLREGDSDIPNESVPIYEARRITPILNADKWYKLFNPRQLLTLVKLVKLIREADKSIEEEKQKEGETKEEAQLYAEAITSYLATSQLKFSDYNTLVNLWNPGSWSWNKVAHSLSMRGIAMQWNWCEINPTIDLPLSYNGTISNAIQASSYLTSSLRANSGNAYALLDDATVFNKIQSEYKPNLIVTDPPYYDDVPYAELSDFYYVWLKRALSDVKDGRLVPRFLPEAFFERVGDGWVDVPTQWEKYALNEVSLNPPRLGASAQYEDGVRHFQNLLNSSFMTMASRLMDDGLLVTYYAHTDPDAWKALLKAGWEAAGFKVTNAFPITTESAQSVVSRGKLSMDTSIVVVWRKGSSGSVDVSKLYEIMVDAAEDRAKTLMDLNVLGRDLFIGTLAAALSTATGYREIVGMGRLDVAKLVDEYVYPATCLGLTRAYARKADLKDGIRSSDAMFYLITKCLLAEAKEKVIESTDFRLLSIGTSLDTKSALSDWKILRRAGKGEEMEGAEVAKSKALYLLEPTSTEPSKIAEFLEFRGVSVSDPSIRCTVDALHLLEYFAAKYSLNEFKRRADEMMKLYPNYVSEALSLAKVFAKVLPENDCEGVLCKRIVEPQSMLG